MKNIHVLPTDKPSRLYLNTQEYIFENEYSLSTDECQNKHIYITSDEEIKEGDWFLWKDTEEPYIFKCIGLTDTDSLQVENSLTKKIGTYHRNPKDSDYGDWYRCYSKKIILTTDQGLIKYGIQPIDDEFLEWFVKNPSCEEVKVDHRLQVSSSEKGFVMDNPNYNKIIIPKEEAKMTDEKGRPITYWGGLQEPKLSNICIKCGVDLYALEGKFVCLKHPKECKGIYLSKETLLIHAAEQKQHLIDMMKSDEELGLYDEPKQDKIMEKFIANAKQQKTLEEAATNYSNKNHSSKDLIADTAWYEAWLGFRNGAKWQQEQMYSEEEVKRFAFDFYYDMSRKMKVPENLVSENETNVDVWFEQFKKK